MDRADLLLHGVLPYAAIAAFLVGHWWRYRHDQMGWGARSTQLLESRALRLGSMVFHYGAFAAIGGHVLGILVPASWTDAAGIDDDAYHVISAVGGVSAGVAVIAGFLILLWRRATNARVRPTTTWTDVAIFGLLAVTIATGMAVTVLNIVDETHYRENVAPWFRSLFVLDPEPERLDGVHWLLQVHVVLAWLLYAAWPMSRLVHVWSIPVDWFRRSPVLFRGRTAAAR